MSWNSCLREKPRSSPLEQRMSEGLQPIGPFGWLATATATDSDRQAVEWLGCASHYVAGEALEEIASVACLLANELSAFTTGQAAAIDAGWSI
jgi:hypothetical protein